MIKILFVCHGNICRSPMAEYLMKDLINKNNLNDKLYVRSKATSNEEIGNPIYPPIKKILNDHNIDSSMHQANRMNKEDYDNYDYIIGMDQNNIKNILKIVGNDKENKVFKLLRFCNSNEDVLDPWYTREFNHCYNEINKGVNALFKYIIDKDL